MTTLHNSILLAFAVLLGGCATRVEVLSVRRSAPVPVLHAVEAPQPRAWWDEPATRPVIQRHGLVAQLRRDPARALRELEAKLAPETHAGNAAALATLIFLHGQRRERTQPQEALGHYLAAAAIACRQLGATAPSQATNQALLHLRAAYNRATAGVVGLLQDLPGGIHSNRVVVVGERTVRIETALDDGASGCGPEGRWLPADRWTQRGLSHHFRNDGFGASLIAAYPNRMASPLELHRPDEGIFDHATAVLEFPPPGAAAAETHTARLIFYNPVLTPEAEVNGARWPLAADYTIPWAMLLSQAKPLLKSRWSALTKPATTSRPRRLYLIGPYSPDRIPVIMVHGLGSTPLAWQELTNELIGDPEIRARYQFWHYLYPTGFPFLTSAADFRDELEDVRRLLDPEGDDLASEHMIVIGHSMGGLLTRTLVTDSGEAIWTSVFAIPASELKAGEDELRELRRWFTFQPKPYVKRVIFIAVPHRGAKLAGGFLGRLVSRRVQLPDELHQLVSRLQESNPGLLTPEAAPAFARGFPDSIRVLSPQSSRLQALVKLPIAPSASFHSIMGDRGIGGGEKSSDGAVAYWSSHLPGAASELIVPAGHRAYEHPLAIAEVKRILKLHLAERALKEPADGSKGR